MPADTMDNTRHTRSCRLAHRNRPRQRGDGCRRAGGRGRCFSASSIQGDFPQDEGEDQKRNRHHRETPKPQTRSAMARVIPRSVHFRIENAKVGWIISGLSRRAHRGGEVEEWACQKVLQNAHMHRQTSNKQGRQPSRGAFLLCQR